MWRVWRVWAQRPGQAALLPCPNLQELLRWALQARTRWRYLPPQGFQRPGCLQALQAASGRGWGRPAPVLAQLQALVVLRQYWRLQKRLLQARPKRH